MTDDELVAELRKASSTYPKWMDRANAQDTWAFRRLINQAAGLAKTSPGRQFWRENSTGCLREFANLQRKVEQPGC